VTVPPVTTTVAKPSTRTPASHSVAQPAANAAPRPAVVVTPVGSQPAEHLTVAPAGSTPAVSKPAGVKPRVRRPTTPRRIELPPFHAVYVIPSVVPPGPGVVAADVRRPVVAVPGPGKENHMLVPASLALLMLVAASGSFLLLARRVHGRWTPELP
jgi:hypothetical protein